MYLRYLFQNHLTNVQLCKLIPCTGGQKEFLKVKSHLSFHYLVKDGKNCN